MVRYRGTVLVDTNVILEAHRTGTLRVLTGGYRVETVEECVTETQTGFQLRRTEWQIDGVELRDNIDGSYCRRSGSCQVGGQGRNIALDEGEAALWATLSPDDWVLCGPDKASLRCGIRLGFRETLVSMQELLNAMAGIGRESLFTRRIPKSGMLKRSENWFSPRERSLMSKASNAFPYPVSFCKIDLQRD